MNRSCTMKPGTGNRRETIARNAYDPCVHQNHLVFLQYPSTGY